MNMLSKVIKALKSSFHETTEVMIDAQALRILDQEVRDASESLKLSKNELSEIKAKQKLAEKMRGLLDKKIKEKEKLITTELEKSKNSKKAKEYASDLVFLSSEREKENTKAKGLKKNVQELQSNISKNEKNIKRLKQQVDRVKAKESLLQAQSVVAERYKGSEEKIRSAFNSLEKIKLRQSEKTFKNEISNDMINELGFFNDSLQEQDEIVEEVNVKENAKEILERLAKKKVKKAKKSKK